MFVYTFFTVTWRGRDRKFYSTDFKYEETEE